MPVCLIDLVHFHPAADRYSALLAREVSHALLARARRSHAVHVVHAVGYPALAGFDTWLRASATVIPCVTVGTPSHLIPALKPGVIVSPLLGIDGADFALDAPARQVLHAPDLTLIDTSEPGATEARVARWEAWSARLGQASRVVAPSAAARAALLDQFGLPPDRVVVIPPGADALDDVQADVEALPVERQFLLYLVVEPAGEDVDRLFTIMAAIWRQQPDRHLVIASTGAAGLSAEALVARYPCPSDRIHCLGPVDEPLLKALYERAEALLVVRGSDRQLLSLLEAMRLGCPVLCLNSPALSEYGRDGVLSVDSDDPEDWARALLDDLPARRQTLMRQARDGTRHLTWKATREGWLRLLDDARAFDPPAERAASDAGTGLSVSLDAALLELARWQLYGSAKQPSDDAPLPVSPEQIVVEQLVRSLESILLEEQRHPFTRLPYLRKLLRLWFRFANLRRMLRLRLTTYRVIVEYQTMLLRRLERLENRLRAAEQNRLQEPVLPDDTPDN